MHNSLAYKQSPLFNSGIFFISPQRNLMSFKQSFPFPLLQFLVTTNLLSVSMDLPILYRVCHIMGPYNMWHFMFGLFHCIMFISFIPVVVSISTSFIFMAE